jgi:hypothetical protein
MASVYQINKGVGRPMVFRGLVGQYIAYLAIGLVVLLILFAVLYISGIALVVVLPLVLGLGVCLFVTVGRLSARFGEHGLMKFFARKGLPNYLRFQSRGMFIGLGKKGSRTALERGDDGQG